MNIMSFWRLGKRAPEAVLYALRGVLPKNAPDTTQPDDDVSPQNACRKAESVGNGVLSSGEKNFSVHKTYMNFLRPRKRAPDTTQPDDDVFPCIAYRKAERAGNGVLSSGEKNFSVHKTYMNFLRPRKRAPETALYTLRGSLLPENGTNATPFLSDVYNNSTRVRKRLAGVSLYALRGVLPKNAPDAKQPDDDVYNLGTRRGRMLVDGALSGRSMVEMLGVLAIIGVLSVGALSGYSQVMWKYKKNKQTEQINTLLHAVIRYKNDLRLNDRSIADSQTSIIPFLRKLGEVPVEMNLSGNHPSYDTVLVDSFNNSLVLYHHGTGYLGMYVDIHHKGYGTQICKNLIDIALPFQHDINALLINSQQTGSHYISSAQNCQESEKCLQNLTLEDRDNYCRLCGETSYCYFYYIIN